MRTPPAERAGLDGLRVRGRPARVYVSASAPALALGAIGREDGGDLTTTPHNAYSGPYLLSRGGRQGLYRANIGSGYGSSRLRSTFSSTGRVLVLGEEPGRFDEGVGFSVSSRGIDVMGVIAPHIESDARCASLALSHSLSLSLSSASGLTPEPPCVPLSRAARNPPEGGRGRVGLSRRIAGTPAGGGDHYGFARASRARLIDPLSGLRRDPLSGLRHHIALRSLAPVGASSCNRGVVPSHLEETVL